MFRRLRNLIGLNSKSAAVSGTRRMLDVGIPMSRPASAVDPDIFEAGQEIGLYIHRFHNLDLFQQGWYQIRITMRWEEGEHRSPGTPARVVQYEVPDLGRDDAFTVWRINDIDHSFSTQPFRIRYARQDVLLSVMISFNLALGKDESPWASAVILKFELLHAPIIEEISELQASLDASIVAVHELRIPPTALLGLHSYCPIYFDAFHAVLVDMSVHVVLLKSGASVTPQKLISNRHLHEIITAEQSTGNDQLAERVISSAKKEVKVVKALYDSRSLLLEELQKLSKALTLPIDDLVDVFPGMSWGELISSFTHEHSNKLTFDDLEQNDEHEENEKKSQHSFQKINGTVDSSIDVSGTHSLSSNELLDAFHTLGIQLSVIWNAFLKFHRMNRAKIVEYLRESWATDRRSEWSIWMIHSTVEIPLLKLKNGVEASHYAVLGKVTRKASDDPSQSAISRAELHRRSIAQMKINNRSVQDMQIFCDPSHVPVVVVEQHQINSLERETVNGSLSFSNSDLKDFSDSYDKPGNKHVFNSVTAGRCRNGRQLSFVVFVHGFQGHHLDLRLVRNQWLLIDPGAECLMSEANEDRTTGDFRDMGARLAEEVACFLKKKMDARSGTYRNVKLSFVGHSIGNIIIRSALTEPAMAPHLKYLHTYMSVSGPHLGYLYSSNSLFNSGLWLLKKLKGAHCIHQLTFSDDPEMQHTFLYKLCKQKTLDNFKNIILLSSPQDGYVPYHSARIEFCHSSQTDSKKGPIFNEMLNACLDQINTPSLEPRTFMRCDVNFDTSNQSRSLNTMIGRAAHIEFLETDLFARFIMWSFAELFT